MILYSYYRSSASHRVRIALNLKGVDYEYRAVHLLNNGGEQHSDEYTKLNPSHEVPTLIHKGRALAQSVAILDYLDQIQPEPRLFPQDPYQRAVVLMQVAVGIANLMFYIPPSVTVLHQSMAILLLAVNLRSYFVARAVVRAKVPVNAAPDRAIPFNQVAGGVSG